MIFAARHDSTVCNHDVRSILMDHSSVRSPYVGVVSPITLYGRRQSESPCMGVVSSTAAL
ncbi:hypothetical protein TorRG33x02_174470, partial [Trema orientale]